MKHLPGVFCVFLTVLPPAFSQGGQGGITGTIRDPQGAALPAASIDVKNTDTGSVYHGGASATGNFLVSVPAGNYELDVTAQGFKKFVRPNIAVPSQTTVRVDAELEIGTINQIVTVADTGAPLLKTESSEIGFNVESTTLDNLPVMQIRSGVRSPYATLNLLPGTTWVDNFDVRINGMPANTQALKIDGQEATNSLWQVQTSQTQPSVDAIQEVAVQTSNYAAEYGEAGGAMVNLTMKSGTNSFHGSGYDYMTNEDLNAGLPYTATANGHHIDNRTRLNDYGFTVGGPVQIPRIYNGRNRTFFFFNWEQWRNKAFVSNRLYTVPTDALRHGDFSLINQGLTTQNPISNNPTVETDPLGQKLYQGQIFDPSSETVINGVRVRSQFLNNMIPLTRTDPVSLTIQKMMPSPLGSGAASDYQNYLAPTFSNHTVNTIPSFKIDHSFSATQKISIYYSLNRNSAPNPNGLPYPINGVIPTDNRTHTARINYDATLKPTLLLHVGIGLMHTVVLQQPQGYDSAKNIGLTGQYANFFPYVTGISAGTQGGYSPTIGPGVMIYLTNDKPTANTSLTWIKGNHTMKLGGEMSVNGFPAVSTEYTNGWLTFSNNETADPSLIGQSGLLHSTGNNYASFLLGGVDSAIIGPPADARLGQHAIGLYAQDSWRANRKLTVELGLRWDYETYLKEQYGRIANFSPSTLNTTTGTLGGVAFEGNGPGRCGCQYASNYPYAVGPHLGLAYQLNPKTVIRAGGALNYSKTGEDGYLSYSIGGLNGYATTTPYSALFHLAGGIPFAGLTFSTFNPGLYPGINPATGVETLSAPAFEIDRNAGRPGRILQWSLSIQRELQRNLVVEVDYVGNRGVWWQANIFPYNALSPQTLAAHGLNIADPNAEKILALPLNSSLVKTSTLGQFGLPYTGFPDTASLAQSLRPYPQFNSGLSPLWAPMGKSWYDSLQAKVTKRYSHGLEIQGTFSWQKALDIGAENSYPLGSAFGGGPSAVANDIFAYNTNKYLSSDDYPYQLVISGTYTTPGWKVNQVVNQVVKDWRLSTVLRYQSGHLIGIPGTNNALASQLLTGTRATRNSGVPYFAQDPNCKCWDPTTQLLLNPDAFSQTPNGQFTQSSLYYDDLRWQRTPQENMGFSRVFRMGKEGRYALETRFEFTNVFNRHFYPAPSSGSLTTATTHDPTTGLLTGGYGFVNTAGGAGAQPRSGQFVARFTF